MRVARLAAAAIEVLRDVSIALRMFGPLDWIVVAAAAALALVAVGVPTAMIETPWFRRMVPIRDQDYVIWALTAVLFGLIVGTYTSGRAERASRTKAVSGGALAYFAVGCPICNKLVLAVLGTSGGLAIFAPLQIYIGLASVGLLFWAMCLRMRARVRCVPPERPRFAATTDAPTDSPVDSPAKGNL